MNAKEEQNSCCLEGERSGECSRRTSNQLGEVRYVLFYDGKRC